MLVQRFYKNMTFHRIKIGYKIKKIPFVPMSGWKGDNLKDKSTNMPWYKGWSVKVKKEKVEGFTLIEALEKVAKPPKRQSKKAFRMPVSGVYKINGVGDVITGRIEQGKLTFSVRCSPRFFLYLFCDMVYKTY